MTNIVHVHDGEVEVFRIPKGTEDVNDNNIVFYDD